MKKPSLEHSYTLSQEPNGYVIINGVKYVKEEPKEETFVIRELPKYFTGWCKIDNMGNDDWIMYFEDGIQQYGIDSNEDWFVPAGVAKIKSYYREATPEEVKEALTKEAVKRGFKEGVYYNCNNVFGRKDNVTCGHVVVNKDSVFCTNNGWIFYKGKWAEICETITKEEAEKLLNKKII